MATNPNPARITDAMWQLWEESAQIIPGVRLGGIYADKRCYHNTVNANKANYPGTYCIVLPLDLNAGPMDKARAIDLTMSEAEMVKRTEYLRRAARHPDDNRLGAVREFYGTLNGTEVFGLIRDASGTWNPATSDPSHLWHIHIGIFTTYVALWAALAPIVNVLDGVTWEEWQDQQGEDETVYVTIESTDAAFNGALFVTDGTNRRRIRKPAEIGRGVRKVFGTEVKLTDADRAGRAWDDFLNGVIGAEYGERLLKLDKQLTDILAAATDDGQVDVTASPEMIAMIKTLVDDLKAETRDAVADLGEGGSKQVRADA